MLNIYFLRPTTALHSVQGQTAQRVNQSWHVTGLCSKPLMILSYYTHLACNDNKYCLTHRIQTHDLSDLSRLTLPLRQVTILINLFKRLIVTKIFKKLLRNFCKSGPRRRRRDKEQEQEQTKMKDKNLRISQNFVGIISRQHLAFIKMTSSL